MDCLEKFCKAKVLLPFIPQVQKHCPGGCNFYRNTVVILKLTFFRKLLPPYVHIITLKIEFWHLSTSDATWGIEEHHTLIIYKKSSESIKNSRNVKSSMFGQFEHVFHDIATGTQIPCEGWPADVSHPSGVYCSQWQTLIRGFFGEPIRACKDCERTMGTWLKEFWVVGVLYEHAWSGTMYVCKVSIYY